MLDGVLVGAVAATGVGVGDGATAAGGGELRCATYSAQVNCAVLLYHAINQSINHRLI